MSDINGLKEQLKRKFKMKHLGAAKRILGMEIQRDRPIGIFYLSQKKNIVRVLQRFGDYLDGTGTDEDHGDVVTVDDC
ncbi:hypothetical protein RJ639_041993 [Escallonia herrerae]|uniref:Reverse transcriptase Ty1/copia-type domain-containing protein n=1 Tax=Escallonia herrerae TaxID=1293975 RepID=A0AA89BBR0_9ASTE|nr:hypothetical protein RJ639_041993 [Escallonia herrerae]